MTVTPGREILLPQGSLRAGQHVSLMGADGPGKAEIAPAELARVHVYCDDWEQASHGGECAAALEAGLLDAGDVTELGRVLADDTGGRASADEITAFDSTGLAIQDLAIALAALERAADLDLPALAVEVREEVTRLARGVRHDQRPAYYDGTSGGRIFLAGLPANAPYWASSSFSKATN